MKTVKRSLMVLIVCAAMLLLYLARLYNYLLFHSITEVFSICIALTVFFLTWNSRNILKNNYVLLVGIAYLFIGILDFFHTISYQGMQIFLDYDFHANQLWIAARYLESFVLLLSFMLMKYKKQINAYLLVAIHTVITTVVLLSVFVWHNFPICFIEGIGQTPFKVASEYIIIAILFASIFMLRKNKEAFQKNVYKFLLFSILTTIASEFCFTTYVSNFGFTNVLGHYFKILSFYFIYRAIIQTGIREPYDLIFREIKQAEQQLYKQNQVLSDQVISDELTITGHIDLLEQQHAALLESRAREAYLLRLSDMIRPLEKTEQILEIVCNLLADFLKTAQVNYFEWNVKEDYAVMRMQARRTNAPNPRARLRVSEYPNMVRTLRSGQIFTVSNASVSPLLSEAERKIFIESNICSQASIPILQDGELLATLTVRQATPREWTPAELALVKETAERAWEALERATARSKVLQSSIVLSNIINSTEDFIWSVDTSYNVLLSNRSVQEFIKARYGTEFTSGMPFASALPAETAKVFLELFDRAKQTGSIVIELRNTFQTDRVISYSLHPVFGGSELLEITVFGRDITERIQYEQEIIKLNALLETRIAERTEELKQSMEMLRNFSMTVTHDLKMPLYEIEKYSDRILHGLDVETNASRIIHSCVNMNMMISELLDYEKTSITGIQKEKVNLKEMFESVYEEYKSDNSVLDFQTGIPAVYADRKLIRHVVENLLSNALKFSSNREIPKIIVGCKKEESEYVCYVKDNGIGVDMRYAEKLFNLFERQGRDGTYKGHGIGLASVRLIIEKHGGRTWINGKVNVGTTVFFTLPTESGEGI